jgi:hypothetical protein
MLTNGNVQLDQYAHLVILVCRVWLMGVQGLIVEESVRVVVLDLLVDLAIDLLHYILAQFRRYLEVFDECLGEE